MAANDDPPLISAIRDKNIVECRRLISKIQGRLNVNEDRDHEYGRAALHIAGSILSRLLRDSRAIDLIGS